MSPSGDDVRRQLDRLLASTVFSNAGRMSRFLRFVVEQTLAGEGERLKEYVIGVEVFDRDASYDPRLDSIVRVEAARLRSKLAEYYAGDGRGDAVILSLPKGGYAPLVTLEQKPAVVNGSPRTNGANALPAVQPELAAPRARSGRRRWVLGALLAVGAAIAAAVIWTPRGAPVTELRVVVLPFSSGAVGVDGEAFAQQLTEGVTGELVRAGRFSVVASSSARAVNATTQRARDVAAALDADVVVGARVRVDEERLRVETYAVDGESEEKLWVDRFEGTAADAGALERDIASAIADALTSAKITVSR
jgi:adenylate cyclase